MGASFLEQAASSPNYIQGNIYPGLDVRAEDGDPRTWEIAKAYSLCATFAVVHTSSAFVYTTRGFPQDPVVRSVRSSAQARRAATRLRPPSSCGDQQDPLSAAIQTSIHTPSWTCPHLGRYASCSGDPMVVDLALSAFTQEDLKARFSWAADVQMIAKDDKDGNLMAVYIFEQSVDNGRRYMYSLLSPVLSRV